MLVTAILNKAQYALIALLEYIDLQLQWQHKTSIWEGLPAFYYSKLL